MAISSLTTTEQPVGALRSHFENQPLVNPVRVTLCGGGRTGHLSACLFGQRAGVRVSLLTRDESVANSLRQRGVTAHMPDGSQLVGRLDCATSDPREALAETDLVILTVPAQARPEVLEALALHLPRDKPVYIGAVPGFCGFDWLAEAKLRDRPNVVIWGLKDVPHTAFALEPGVSVRMGGAKQDLYVATHRRETPSARAQLRGLLARLYNAPVTLLDDYLEITLTPGNPIMHSAVIYGLVGPYGQWHGRPIPKPLCWWRDCPELAAYFIERMDEESRALCRAAERRLGIELSSIKALKQEIVEAYGEQIADTSTMLSVLRTNQAYDDIPAPLVPHPEGAGYAIDSESRAFHEDVAFGLALLVEMARRLEVDAPHLIEVFDWTSAFMGGLRSSSLDYVPTDWPGNLQ